MSQKIKTATSGQSTTKTRPRQRKIDPHSVNMPELFGDLIRERSLYSVVDAFAQACRSRADHFRENLTGANLNPITARMYERQAQFFEEARDNVRLVRTLLEHEWGEDAPICADGDLNRMWDMMARTTKDWFREIIGQLGDPNVSDDEKRDAAAELAKVRDTKWRGGGNRSGSDQSEYDRQLDSRVNEAFTRSVDKLNDPNTSLEDNEEALEFLRLLVKQPES